MKFLLPALLCFSLVFQSCTNKTKEATAEEPQIQAQDGLLEGWLSIGPRSRIFTPCGSTFPVIVDSPSKAVMTAYKDNKEDYLYAPVYVLVEGNLKASRAYPYGQAISIDNVLAASSKGPDKCKLEVPALFSASGNEPAWKVQIDEAKETITFTKNFGKEVIKFPYAHPQSWGENWTWMTTNEAGLPMTIKSTRNECSDSMSGQVYSDEVVVQFAGTDYQGCGGKKIR